MAAKFSGFPPEALQFLSDLRENNDRDWFNERKSVFKEKVEAPMRDLVLALGEEFDDFAPGMQTEPKKAIYRIYRDIRFSSDKRPYKTHIAASFSPIALEKHVSAGYYFHLSPEEFLVGGGLWAPGSKELLLLRQKLAGESERFRGILAQKDFRKFFGELEGEALKRAPKGFDEEHPAIDLLRQKQFLAGGKLDPELAETPKVLSEIAKRFRALTPMIEFLNEPFLSKAS